jgi:hypothetical protein
VSLLYLCNLFSNPIPSAGVILDAIEPENLQLVLNGGLVIRVPNNVQVENPPNVANLLTQKYQGLLAAHAPFANITFDDLLDASHVDATSGPGIFGQRGTISIAPGGTFSSVINAGAGTPLTGSAPAQALVTWEVFTVTDADPASGMLQRTYTELASTPSFLTCQVSFNGGSTYIPATDTSFLYIAPANMGTAFILRLTNVSQERLYVGSWAVLY